MGGYSDANRNRKAKAIKKLAAYRSGRVDFGVAMAQAWSETNRIGELLRRVGYRRWTFSAINTREFDAFRSDPADPKKLQRVGPWTLPENPTEEDVRAAALAAVISVDGESVRDVFRWRA
jgi:hypothetical protein